jgi:GDSL-like Lipase/Acylhydrolase family
MKRVPIANITLLVVLLATLIGGAEAIMRVRASRARTAMRAGLRDAMCTMAASDRRLIYTYRPGQCGSNSQGYRDREHPFKKPTGTFRIVLIGDSVAEGRDVAPDSTFGQVLERMLDDAHPGQHYEVVLLARAGYSTGQELVLLEEEAFRYEPDMILWSYCLNDPADPVYHNANGNLGAYYYQPRSQLLALARAFAFRAGQKWRGRGCSNKSDFHAFLHCACRHQIERDIQRIGATVRQHGVSACFIVHPVFEDRDSFDDYSLAGVHAQLVEMASSAGLIPIDLLEAFRGYNPHALKIDNPRYFDPWHMNERGHRVAAAYIQAHIEP